MKVHIDSILNLPSQVLKTVFFFLPTQLKIVRTKESKLPVLVDLFTENMNLKYLVNNTSPIFIEVPYFLVIVSCIQYLNKTTYH